MEEDRRRAEGGEGTGEPEEARQADPEGREDREEPEGAGEDKEGHPVAHGRAEEGVKGAEEGVEGKERGQGKEIGEVVDPTPVEVAMAPEGGAAATSRASGEDGEGEAQGADVADAPRAPASAGVGKEPRRSRTVRPGRRGPVEGEHLVGVDPPERRPGVPMEGEVADAPPVEGRPLRPQEEQRGRRLHRPALDEPTAVFGTAQPYHGLSGRLRDLAYEIPEHHTRHWLLLLAADRMEAQGEKLADLLAAPLEGVGATGAAERVRSRPVLALGAAALGALALRRLLR